jgi:hypothetical protein
MGDGVEERGPRRLAGQHDDPAVGAPSPKELQQREPGPLCEAGIDQEDSREEARRPERLPRRADFRDHPDALFRKQSSQTGGAAFLFGICHDDTDRLHVRGVGIVTDVTFGGNTPVDAIE